MLVCLFVLMSEEHLMTEHGDEKKSTFGNYCLEIFDFFSLLFTKI